MYPKILTGNYILEPPSHVEKGVFVSRLPERLVVSEYLETRLIL